MPRALLSRHLRTSTVDVDQARDEVAATFCPHRLALTKPGARLDMVHNAAVIGQDVVLNYLRYGDEVRITPGAFEKFFLVQVPLAGSARVRVGQREVASDRRHASLGSPTEPVDMVWSDGCAQLLVYIRREAVEQLAATEPGGTSTVVFDPLVDLAADGIRDWMRLVALAVDALDSGGGLFDSDLVASHYEQALIAGVLAVQPNTSCTVARGVEPRSRAVGVVVDLIEAEPERPWRLADLAAHAGVSPRSLQAAFRRDLDLTPLEHLRHIRLDRARRSLLAADPASVSVADVAARCGFFHLGRFAQAYRAIYQEPPSRTLAR